MLYFIVETREELQDDRGRELCSIDWGTLVLLDGAALLHEKALLCVQRIVACGAANGRFKLLRYLVAPDVNTHKGRVVFECSAHHLSQASQISVYILHEFVVCETDVTNLTTIITQSVGRHVNPGQSGIKSAKA